MDTARKSPGFLHLLPLKGGGEWLHMCIRHKETSTYLMDEVALDDLIVDALMEEDTRSRLRVRDEGIMVLLKAMHLRGEDMARPEDMISMRLWLTPDRVISTREADVDPILEIARRLAKGDGPATPGAFLADLVEEHLDEVETQVEMIEDDATRIAQMIGSHKLEFACPNMADTETRISGFLRHLAPQRPVLATLSTLHHPVLDGRHRARLDDGRPDAGGGDLGHVLQLAPDHAAHARLQPQRLVGPALRPASDRPHPEHRDHAGAGRRADRIGGRVRPQDEASRDPHHGGPEGPDHEGRQHAPWRPAVSVERR